MINYSACYKLLLIVLALALLFQQVRLSGPPIRPSNANQNGVSKPPRNNQALPRSANMSAGAGKKKQSTRPIANVTAAPNNGKVSVQLSRVIQQETEVGEDRSFSNPSADRVEERVIFDRGNSSNSSLQTPNFPLPLFRQHFKPGKLLALLDNEFDPLWLSIEPPTSRVERPPSISTDPDLFEKSDALNFSVLTLYDSIGDAVRPAPALISLFKAFLNRYATCQMEYVWEEMDLRFWPRYIKRGTCLNESPCSWPPGMRCKQSRTKTLKILRWVCDQVKDYGRSKRDSPPTIAVQARGGAKKDKRRNNKEKVGRRKKDKRDAFYTDPDTMLVKDHLFCRWQPLSYTVVEKCSCSCSP